MSSPVLVKDLLASSDATRLIAQRIGFHLAADTALRNHLPLSLKPHCKVVNYMEGVLIVHTTSPVWFAKLRYLIPGLTRRLRGEPLLAGLIRMEIEVRPGAGYALKTLPPAPRRLPGLSEKNLELLANSAESVENPALRAALLRLSRRMKERSEGA